MSLHLRHAFLSVLLVALPIVASGCGGASNGEGSSAPAAAGSSDAGFTVEEEVNRAIARFLENFIESAQDRDAGGEKVVAAWQFLPPSVQNKLSADGGGPSPDMIARYLELSGTPDSEFEIEIIEADFMTKTGSARITLRLSGEPVVRLFKLERVNCEGIVGSADEFNERIEECRRTNVEPWKITKVTVPE